MRGRSHLATGDHLRVAIETLHEAGAEVLFAPSEPRSTHGDAVLANEWEHPESKF